VTRDTPGAGPGEATIPAAKCPNCGHHARIDEVTACRFCDCTEHRGTPPGPYQGHDPQTPPGAEAALQSFSDALEDGRLALAAARDAELVAKNARDAAKRRWTLSEDCPRVARDAFTVAYRDAWVEEQIAGEQLAYDLARTARQAASEHLHTLREQGSIQQSISKSVGDSYRGTRGTW
jgi:hypothetical protein